MASPAILVKLNFPQGYELEGKKMGPLSCKGLLVVEWVVKLQDGVWRAACAVTRRDGGCNARRYAPVPLHGAGRRALHR